MEKPVEFSEVYRAINAIKEGDKSKKEVLDKMLTEFASGESADSFLHEIGQKFITVGIEELFKHKKTNDFQLIGELSNEEWTEIANKMISYAKKNQISKILSSKWETPRREIEKHVISMARYITEGLIDSLE